MATVDAQIERLELELKSLAELLEKANVSYSEEKKALVERQASLEEQLGQLRSRSRRNALASFCIMALIGVVYAVFFHTETAA
eukprot:m.15736 g.15736  ORF g.15736 m.15736 type:complete len:83 (+) comp7453_c0_seq1:56-304(+)